MKRFDLQRRVASVIAALGLSFGGLLLGEPALTARAAVAPCTVQWGMYQPNAPWDPNMVAIRALDTATGRHSSIVHYYSQWGDNGSGTFAANQPWMLKAIRNYTSVGVTGATPLITWEAWASPMTVANNAYPLSKIAAGSFDAYIDSWAVGLRTYGGPVMLDFGHEMDGNWYPWGYNVNGNTVAGYIAAFRHVHDRFAAAGATNVQFVWNPTVWNPGGVDQRVFYPGDAYVDWMAIDVYNWGAAGGGWASLSSALGSMTNVYTRVAGLSNKPMMLAEWASAEPVAGDPLGVTKGQWIIDSAAAMVSQFPRLKAVIWFNQGTFALNSSANSQAGAAIAFGGCGSTPAPPPPPPPPPPPAPSPVASPVPPPVPSTAPKPPSPTPSTAPKPPSPAPSSAPGRSPSPGAAVPPKAAPKSPAPIAAPPGATLKSPGPKPPSASSAPAGASPAAARLVSYTAGDPGAAVFLIGLLILVLAFFLWAIPRAIRVVVGGVRRE
jgi:beta-mannanase